jgi:sigma-E factor negative regulatory protein RseC
MIAARAVVVRAGDGKVWAQLLEHQGCGRCNEPGGCHAPQLAEMFSGGKQVFALEDSLGLSSGERVKVVINDGLPLRAALMSYGLGTALVLAGAALGVWLAPPGWADAAAGAGVLLGVAIMTCSLGWRASRTPAAWRLRVERDTGEAIACRRESA